MPGAVSGLLAGHVNDTCGLQQMSQKKKARLWHYTRTGSIRLPLIGAGRFQSVYHLFNGYLSRIVGDRVDLLKALKAACHVLYAVQPFQG